MRRTVMTMLLWGFAWGAERTTTEAFGGESGATKSPVIRQVGAAANRAEVEISHRAGNLYNGPLEYAYRYPI